MYSFVFAALFSASVSPAALGGPAALVLPAPARQNQSFELLANSRSSIHSGFDDSLPLPVLSAVLRSMESVERIGTYRDIYVASAKAVYRYDREMDTFALHRSGDRRYNSGSAYEVGIACDRPEEVGMTMQAALLTAAAFRADESIAVAACPMKWAADQANVAWRPAYRINIVIVLGRAVAQPLDTICVARSSDSSLPLPFVTGVGTFDQVLVGQGPDTTYEAGNLSLETISQLCWACYGVTPHITYNSRQGLTVPSAGAGYPLTGKVYVVNETGVWRYHNRLPPGNDPTTADHRIAPLANADQRPALRMASDRVPGTAPLYFVVCVADSGADAAVQEAGCAAFQLLCQARALGLAGHLTMPLGRSERSAIAAAVNLPAREQPIFIFSCGEPRRAVAEAGRSEGLVRIVRAHPAIRKGRMNLEYWLAKSGVVRVEVFDMLGRPVTLLSESSQSAGYHSVTWDGTGADGRRLERGTYLMVIFSRGSVAKHKVTLG